MKYISCLLVFFILSGLSAEKTVSSEVTPVRGRAFGLFVGISDYPGRNLDLELCAQDARRFHDALVQSGNIESGNAYILTDRQATVENFENSMRRIASRMAVGDVLVFFYSGHGDKQWRDTRQAAEPDMQDETLVLQDGEISDDRLAGLFAPLKKGVVLVIIDACFSGGFREDLIDRDGRLGLFSSEETELSHLPGNIRAGGFLSGFVIDSVCDRICIARADFDRNGEVTAQELVKYVQDRYAKDMQKNDLIRDLRRNPAFDARLQHLVVADRRIAPFFKLFSSLRHF